MGTVTALKRAIQLIGSQSALARRLGIRQQSVNQWANGLRPVPPKRALEIERITEGAIQRHELRPDVYPRETRAA